MKLLFEKLLEGKEVRKLCMKHKSCRYKNKDKGTYSKKIIQKALQTKIKEFEEKIEKSKENYRLKDIWNEEIGYKIGLDEALQHARETFGFSVPRKSKKISHGFKEIMGSSK